MNNDDDFYVNSPFVRIEDDYDDYDNYDHRNDYEESWTLQEDLDRNNFFSAHGNSSPVQPQSYPAAGAELSVQEVQTVNPTFLPGQSIPGAIPPQSYPPMPQPYYSPYVPGGITPLLPIESRELKKEGKKVRKFQPMIVDDPVQCCTYVVHLQTEEAQKFALTIPRDRILTHLNSADQVRIEEIGDFCFPRVQQFGNKIQLHIVYKDNESGLKSVIFNIPEEVYRSGNIVDAIRRNGILCFNPELSDRKINQYLRQYIRQNLHIEETPPQLCGFGVWKSKPCFVSAEFCQSSEIPEITVKHFAISCDESFEEIGMYFIKFAEEFPEPEQFILLTIIRVAGLLTTLMSEAGLIFNKIIFINGDSEIISLCLQIYDREIHFQHPYKINVREKMFRDYFSGIKDDILMLEENTNDSTYKKNLGKQYLGDLRTMLHENTQNEKAVYPFLMVLLSKCLAQEMDNDAVFLLNMPDLWVDTCVHREVRTLLYDFDRKIVNRICSEMSDFQSRIIKIYNKWISVSNENSIETYSGAECFAFLMSIAELLIWYYPVLSKKFPIEYMAKYLEHLIIVSEQNSSGGDVTKEFIQILNQLINEEEIELRRYSKINNSTGDSKGIKPVVWLNEDWLYLSDEAFEEVSDWMQLSPTSCAVRKQLRNKHLLYPGEELQIKVTLYGHQKYVTAIKSSMLQSRQRLLGGNFNFIPCENVDNTKVPIGMNEEGRIVYLSLFHSDLKNRHIEIIGDSGTGKSTAANRIVHHLYQMGQNIIYIDFSNSNTQSKMVSHGYDESFYDKHIMKWNISDIADTDDLHMVLEDMQEEKKILVFRDTQHSDTTEQFLTMLYNTVATDEKLSVTLVIDEVHELDFSKGSALYHIIEKGRGNGISLISIFQGAHEMKPRQFSMLNQSAVKLMFGISDAEDAHKCAASAGLKPAAQFTELLGNLPKQACLVTGSLEDEEGGLKPGCFAVVTIPDVD